MGLPVTRTETLETCLFQKLEETVWCFLFFLFFFLNESQQAWWSLQPRPLLLVRQCPLVTVHSCLAGMVVPSAMVHSGNLGVFPSTIVLPLATLTPGEHPHFTLQQTPPPHLPYFLCFSSEFFQQDSKYQGAERPNLRSSSGCFRHQV